MERDRKLVVAEEGEALAWRDKGLAPELPGYQVERDVSLLSQTTRLAFANDDQIDQYWPPFLQVSETGPFAARMWI